MLCRYSFSVGSHFYYRCHTSDAISFWSSCSVQWTPAELNCTTTGGYLEWDFCITANGSITTIPRRLVNNGAGPGLTLTPLMTDSILFHISRVSLPKSLPLVSKLLISPATNSRNGTEVNCTCTDSLTGVSSSTIVFVINESSVLQGMSVQ